MNQRKKRWEASVVDVSVQAISNDLYESQIRDLTYVMYQFFTRQGLAPNEKNSMPVESEIKNQENNKKEAA